MKNIFIIQDSIENKISYYHLGLFLALLPFDRLYTELILISFILHTVFHINRQRVRAIASWQNLILSTVFVVGILGLLWSQDKVQGIKDLQRQLALLLFPVVLSATGLDLRRYRNNLLLLFGLSCTVTILYLYIDAIRIIIYNRLSLKELFSRSFINHNFSEPIGTHATYMAMYVSLSLAAFLYFFTSEKKQTSRWVYILAITIMLAGLVQLASRSVFISMAVFSVIFPLFIANKQNKFRWIVGVAGIALLALIAITQVDSFQTRYVTSLKDDLSIASINNKVPESRLTRWRLAMQLAYTAPFIGHGSGSEKRMLKETYFENKLYRSYLQELNSHNQYLSMLLKTGVIGLLVFLLTLYAGFAAAWRTRDAIFCCFMLLVSIVSFSENILDVNKGIFFYAFFFAFFMKTGKPFSGLFRLG